MKPMNLAAFAELIGWDEDEFYALDYFECCAVIRKHGYMLTGFGIVPDPNAKQKPKEHKN